MNNNRNRVENDDKNKNSFTGAEQQIKFSSSSCIFLQSSETSIICTISKNIRLRTELK
jgi:hypothetical protein